VDEMDEHMIEQWNSVIKQGDIVYHLGDVVIDKTDEDRKWFKKNWPRLKGSKRLIVGNHDDIPFLSSGGFFKKVGMWRMFPEFGLLLTHVPVHPSNLRIFAVEEGYKEGDVAKEQRQFLNVHGHIHQNASPEGPYRNMSVEAVNYTPVNIEEIRVK
jgi:calcineurin-like phosphoesterase family protein